MHQLAETLAEEQTPGICKCYEIPCGGSNVLGTFGYLNAVTEMIQQARDHHSGNSGGSSSSGDSSAVDSSAAAEESNYKKLAFPYDHLVFGCGSGGTAAGLAIGVHLAKLDVKVHAVGVCDSPDDFYEVVRHKAESLGLKSLGLKQGLGGAASNGEAAEAEVAAAAEGSEKDNSGARPPLYDEVRSWLSIYDGQGLGYSKSTAEELQFLFDVSSQTGISLDPVYSGKALYKLCADLVMSKPETFMPGHKVLFVHTGGALGNYSKGDQLLPLMRAYPLNKIEPL